ncbi:hypothetical protein Tco_1085430 [Tanacetum coccineum]
MIDSQIDDMIREKLALKEQVDSLEQNLSKQIKEKECLLQTFIVFKSESKEKEDKYIGNEIDLEKKIKELDNILFKVGQSAQAVYLLTKPRAFYDNIHKQALGYQNPFHLKKAQRIKPTLYDGIVMSDKSNMLSMHVMMIEETLIMGRKRSQSKILSGYFGKRFTPQQEMDVEYAFWFHIFNPIIESIPPPVKVEVPSKLPKFSVDKQCLEIAKKELFLENDRLLQQIMSQDVLLTVINSMSLIGEIVNMDGNRKESCNLEAELLKSQNAFNDLLKQFFANNDLKAQLQDKDSTICKLKDIIKSMREKSKEENVKYDYCEIETKNVELENSVAKLLLENERLCNEINHVKHIFKEQFDSIKNTRVRSKEHSDSLIDKLNLKSAKNEDLKAQIQDKVFVITFLKNDLRKLKGKEIVDIAAQIPSANTIVPGMFKLDLEPLAPRLLQNRDVHVKYFKYAQEQADILWE